MASSSSAAPVHSVAIAVGGPLEGRASVEHQIAIHVNDLFAANASLHERQTPEDLELAHHATGLQPQDTVPAASDDKAKDANVTDVAGKGSVSTAPIATAGTSLVNAAQQPVMASASGEEIAVEEVLAGLQYVMSYRIRHISNGVHRPSKMPNLSLDLCRRLCHALIPIMGSKNGRFLRQELTPAANMAFLLFAQFMEEGNPLFPA